MCPSAVGCSQHSVVQILHARAASSRCQSQFLPTQFERMKMQIGNLVTQREGNTVLSPTPATYSRTCITLAPCLKKMCTASSRMKLVRMCRGTLPYHAKKPLAQDNVLPHKITYYVSFTGDAKIMAFTVHPIQETHNLWSWTFQGHQQFQAEKLLHPISVTAGECFSSHVSRFLKPTFHAATFQECKGTKVQVNILKLSHLLCASYAKNY